MSAGVMNPLAAILAQAGGQGGDTPPQNPQAPAPQGVPPLPANATNAQLANAVTTASPGSAMPDYSTQLMKMLQLQQQPGGLTDVMQNAQASMTPKALMNRMREVQNLPQSPLELRDQYIRDYFGVKPGEKPTKTQTAVGILKQIFQAGAGATPWANVPNRIPSLKEQAENYAQKTYGEQTQRMQALESESRIASANYRTMMAQTELQRHHQMLEQRNTIKDAIQASYDQGRITAAEYANRNKAAEIAAKINNQQLDLQLAEAYRTGDENRIRQVNQVLLTVGEAKALPNVINKLGVQSKTDQKNTLMGTETTHSNELNQFGISMIPRVPGIPALGQVPQIDPAKVAPWAQSSAKHLNEVSMNPKAATNGAAGMQPYKNILDAAGVAPNEVSRYFPSKTITQQKMPAAALSFSQADQAINAVSSLIASGEAAKFFGPLQGSNLAQAWKDKFKDFPYQVAIYDAVGPATGLGHLGAVMPAGGRLMGRMMEEYSNRFGEQSDAPENVLRRLVADRLLLQGAMAQYATNNTFKDLSLAENQRMQKLVEDYITQVKGGNKQAVPPNIADARRLAPPPMNSSQTKANTKPQAQDDLRVGGTFAGRKIIGIRQVQK